MKNLIILFLFSISAVTTSAQIDFIAEYESISTLVLVDDATPKIFVRDFGSAEFSLYNLDNTLYKSVIIPV
jgi:hypothetical protein